MAERKIKVTISGVGINNPRYDCQMSCEHFYVFNDPDLDIDELYNNNVNEEGDITYSSLSSNELYRNTKPLIMNYSVDANVGINVAYRGLYIGGSEGDVFSFYRREYSLFERGWKDNIEQYEFKGEWEPVAVVFDRNVFRDYNIKSGYAYQYIMYPDSLTSGQTFANGTQPDDAIYGDPVRVNFNDWSLIELIPEENAIDTPSLKKTYKADINNLWLFKCALEVGAQKQSITKTSITTLGKYPRISHGEQNSVSGQVTCLLGSEVVPYTVNGYVERLWQARETPLSTNEKALMLNKWREFAFSKNPKLLRDKKGQAWIVSILTNENTPYNDIYSQPDKISFTWAEIEGTKNVVIYGDADEIPSAGNCKSVWNPKIILNK